MIVGHIGVRKGSKGVVGKNFRDFLGKPLIDWSLDQLLAHPRVDAVVVSTDDETIYAHAVGKGCLEMGFAHLNWPATLRPNGMFGNMRLVAQRTCLDRSTPFLTSTARRLCGRRRISTVRWTRFSTSGRI